MVTAVATAAVTAVARRRVTKVVTRRVARRAAITAAPATAATADQATAVDIKSTRSSSLLLSNSIESTSYFQCFYTPSLRYMHQFSLF